MAAGPDISRLLATQSDDMLLAAYKGGVLPGVGKQPPAKPGQGKPGAPAAEPPADPLDAIDAKIGLATMGIMGAQLGIPALGGAFNWAGKKTGSGMLTRAGAGLKAAGEMTFADIGSGIPLLGSVGRGVSNAAASVAGLFTDGLHAIGITDFAANRHAAQAVKHADNLHTAANTLFAHQVSHPKLSAALAEVHTHLQAGPVAMNHEAFAEAMRQAENIAGEVGHGAVGKSLKAVGKHAARLEQSVFFADGYQNLSHYTRNAPASFAKQSVLHGAMNASFVAGAAISDIHTGVDLRKALTNLKSMYANITGTPEEEVSGWSLMLSGKAPEPVKAARAEIFKEYGPAVVLDAANTVLNVKFAVSNNFGSLGKNMLLLMAVPLANQMLVRNILGGQLLPAYEQMKNAEAAGEALPAESYAKLIGNASRELYDRGGEGSNFAKALGQIYANAHAKVDVVLREIDNGTLHKRIELLQRDYEKQQREAGTQPPEAKEAGAPEAVVSHVDRLKGNGKIAQREVLGEHTEKLARPVQVPGQQPSPA